MTVINARPTNGLMWPRIPFEEAIGIIPAGGLTGQALFKASNADFDVGWGDVTTGSGDDTAKRWPWDQLPAVPDALDDPFDGPSLDPKWTVIGGAGLTTVVKRGWLYMSATPTGATFDCRGIEQVLPAGNFSVIAIVMLGDRQYSLPAIHIRNITTGQMLRWAMFQNSGGGVDAWVGVHRYNSLTNRTAIIAQTSFPLYEIAMRISYDGTNISFAWSRNGLNWFTYVTEAIGTTFGGGAPDRVGLSVDPVSATLAGFGGFQAFRHTTSAASDIGAFA